MAPNFIQEFYKGQADFAETFRLLVLQENEDLFSRLDFNNDNNFLDPFLFLYYKQKFLALTQTTGLGLTLEQVLFGYIPKKKLPPEYNFKALCDAEGRIYLPKKGYFILSLKGEIITISYQKENNAYTIFFDSQKLPYHFVPEINIKQSQIVLYQFNDPLFNTLYATGFARESETRIKNGKPGLVLSPVSLLNETQVKINYAYRILRSSKLNYSELLAASTKGIFSFAQEGIWSFAGKAAQGISFICGNSTDSVVFFVCEIAHQGGHSIFNAILHKPEQIFLGDPDASMTTLTDNPADERTITDAFHGLFTTAKVAEVLDYLYSVQSKLKLTLDDKHEIIGRIADNYYRHRTGLHQVDHKAVFTKKGLAIYESLDRYLTRIYKKYGDIPAQYRYGRGDFVFNYEAFKSTHPLENTEVYHAL